MVNLWKLFTNLLILAVFINTSCVMFKNIAVYYSDARPCVSTGVVGVYVSPTDFCIVVGLIYAQGLVFSAFGYRKVH